jgi:hypothetical protein
MFSRQILLLILFFSINLSFSQEQQVAKYYFGISILENSSGETVRYGIIRVSPNGDTKITYVIKQQFLIQVAGHMESKANPDNINLWQQNKVNWKALDLLWKLKFSEYPYDRREDTEGWANLTYGPSPGQLRFLSKYGIKKSISEFIYGENMFQLLKDILSPEWQYNYSML